MLVPVVRARRPRRRPSTNSPSRNVSGLRRRTRPRNPGSGTKQISCESGLLNTGSFSSSAIARTSCFSYSPIGSSVCSSVVAAHAEQDVALVLADDRSPRSSGLLAGGRVDADAGVMAAGDVSPPRPPRRTAPACRTSASRCSARTGWACGRGCTRRRSNRSPARNPPGNSARKTGCPASPPPAGRRPRRAPSSTPACALPGRLAGSRRSVGSGRLPRPSGDPSRMNTPITSYPSRSSSAAATELSTPPLIASTTFFRPPAIDLPRACLHGLYPKAGFGGRVVHG